MSWPLPIPLDTTPEAARLQRDWWLGMTPEGRLEFMEEHKSSINAVRFQRFRRLSLGASDAEVYAIWLGDTYKDELAPEVLKATQRAIRARDNAAPSD